MWPGAGECHVSRGIGHPHPDRPTLKNLFSKKFNWLKSRGPHSKLVDPDCSKSYQAKLPAERTCEEKANGEQQVSQHRVLSSIKTLELLSAAEMKLLSVNEKTYSWKF